MFIYTRDELVNLDNIKGFYIEEDGIKAEDWRLKAETFDNRKHIICSFSSEDSANSYMRLIAEKIKEQRLLIEIEEL